ncbi:N-acetyltransferase [Tropicimonas sp. IMCC6043]|uniref:GNAT family N-acetyltransferase n=1 Tax=Tropicimonas sp. IMCC6043 TaxID=2510645 RepID=UPI00101C8DEC|nr:GNAT family N-acetyltransferase [Tropicimonas sp. IMCC6043]RYH10966.1 GNAT family N-acetyltransferase [Tropicimonas sp. IMCC6043]
MTEPDAAELLAAGEATWPAARRLDIPGWRIRDGAGGGQRVSSATALGRAPSVPAMEAAQARLGQVPLVMVRPDETTLDAALDAAGYRIKDPVTIYLAPVAALAEAPPPVSAFHVACPPLRIQEEIWAEGGIGPDRLAVMARAQGPKAALLGRTADQPSGAAFVAIHGNIAMLHALEVTPQLRRSGTARHLMRGAAIWAGSRGAAWLSVLVTRENAPANALYAKLGMWAVGSYHYRVKQPVPSKEEKQ